MRAVTASLSLAVVLAAIYLAYDVALTHGADLPGGDLRVLALAGYVAIVLTGGSLVTWLVVPQPTGVSTVVRRSGWRRSECACVFADEPRSVVQSRHRAAR